MSTAVGSMIEANDKKIILVGAKNHAIEAATRLNNIGYDYIEGFVKADVFTSCLGDDTKTSIPVTDFEAIGNNIKTEGLTIVDVRSQPEYDKRHIQGAIHAPYTRLPEYLDQLPKHILYLNLFLN